MFAPVLMLWITEASHADENETPAPKFHKALLIYRISDVADCGGNSCVAHTCSMIDVCLASLPGTAWSIRQSGMSTRKAAFAMFDGMNDRFIDAANLFIDLLNRDTLGVGSPHCLVCQIGHEPARVVDWPLRHMFGNPFVQKVSASLLIGSGPDLTIPLRRQHWNDDKPRASSWHLQQLSRQP